MNMNKKINSIYSAIKQRISALREHYENKRNHVDKIH